MADPNIFEFADTLVSELQANDHDVTVLDLLDCLACAGLTLAPDFEGAASTAYLLSLGERPNG